MLVATGRAGRAKTLAAALEATKAKGLDMIRAIWGVATAVALVEDAEGVSDINLRVQFLRGRCYGVSDSHQVLVNYKRAPTECLREGYLGSDSNMVIPIIQQGDCGSQAVLTAYTGGPNSFDYISARVEEQKFNDIVRYPQGKHMMLHAYSVNSEIMNRAKTRPR